MRLTDPIQLDWVAPEKTAWQCRGRGWGGR